jgi:hypothetical protein
VVNVMPRPLYRRQRDPVPILQDAGWTPGPVWTGVGISSQSGIRSLDRPTRSKSLCHLRYPGPRRCTHKHNNVARSRNHTCRAKSICITHSECISLSLVIQQAMHMRRIILSYRILPKLSHKRNYFRKNVIQHNMPLLNFSGMFV